jgi:dTDP-4-amino-4,6-dideoxygalactose transaminase
VTRFETDLALRTGAGHAVSCSSGTAALHLACLALELGPGDAAIVPSITFLATANAVRMTGAEPVFADVSPSCGLMGRQDLADAWDRAEAAGLRVKAVLPVHLAGQCADMAALAGLVQARGGAAIVEDACHALGASHRGPAGTMVAVGSGAFSAMTVLSFHPVKTVAAGEGGAVLTNDRDLAERLACLRNHGMVRAPERLQNRELGFDSQGTVNPWYYEMAEIGWNYRLSDIHAALACSQLRRLDGFVAERRLLVERYDDALTTLNRTLGRELIRPIARTADCVPAWHLYAVRIDFEALGLDRAAIMRELLAHGIGSQVHYIPVHRQPYYAARNGGLVLNGADTYYRQTLSMPLFVGMEPTDVGRVITTLADALLGRHETVSTGMAAQ